MGMQVYENEKLRQSKIASMKYLLTQKQKILEGKPDEAKIEVVVGELPVLGDILVAKKTELRFMVRSTHGRDRFMVGLLRPERAGK
jgi:hypothetical protein